MRKAAKGVDRRFLQESYKSLKSRRRIFDRGENKREQAKNGKNLSTPLRDTSSCAASQSLPWRFRKAVKAITS
jgi:hypothetical protein